MLIPQDLGCEPKSKSERLFHYSVVGIIAENIGLFFHAALPLTFVWRSSCVESQHPVISVFPTSPLSPTSS